MPTVAEALRQHADSYLRQYADGMPTEHKRVLAVITRCRTGELGHLHYECDTCRRTHWVAEVVGVYRVAISNNRIVAVDESSVSYRFTPTGSQQSVTRTVPGNEFVLGFLQHTLPRDFHRLRYYGFGSQNSKLSMGWVRMLVWLTAVVLLDGETNATRTDRKTSGSLPRVWWRNAFGGDHRWQRSVTIHPPPPVS